jgi:hypothetical protein
MSEDFLSRWSRRKAEARREAAAEDKDGQRQNPADPLGPPAEPTLTPDEIAALPSIKELTAETDVTVFLRRGVPETLRNAALRRTWLLDPAIRDFAGHARDYDYDWNIPGGAPGHGALEPGDDVTAMLRRILGAPEGEAAVPPRDRETDHAGAGGSGALRPTGDQGSAGTAEGCGEAAQPPARPVR